VKIEYAKLGTPLSAAQLADGITMAASISRQRVWRILIYWSSNFGFYADLGSMALVEVIDGPNKLVNFNKTW
jgi:hypothetical protein